MDRRGFLRFGAAASVTATATAAAPAGISAAERWSNRTFARPHLLENGDLRLNANENPLGLSEKARNAVLDAMVDANRYPFIQHEAMEVTLASKRGVGQENVFLGAGSTEVLQMAVQALQGPRTRLVVADPTFEDVGRYQNPFPYQMERVPLDFRYAHDIARMREVVGRSRTPTVVYICNPNNPTGTITPSAEVDAWIQDAPETVFFIIDEAYFELVEAPNYWSMAKWIHDKPNVLVARTFSKIYGMAGMRLGYGMAHPDTVLRMKEFIQQNNANVLAIAAAMASLEDDDHVIRSRAVNAASRRVVEDTLDELGLGRLESHTNFLMHKINGDLTEYAARFRERGIWVGRPFPPMLDYNRLSLALPEDMERWADVLRDFRSRGWV
jgi:histidinol-phosphate aminotransferase